MKKILVILPLFTMLIFAKGYYPTKDEIHYPNKITASPSNFCQLIDSAKPKTTIILKDGEYGSCLIKDKNHITIIAGGDNVNFSSSEYALYTKNSHHINIIGLHFKKGGVLKSAGYVESSHHVYLGSIKSTNGGAGQVIFTGPQCHDFTLDYSKIVNQVRGEYAWYALGYHQSVSNSYFEARDSAIMIRGYHPLNIGHRWSWKARDPISKNISAYKQLPADEWTHQIINNEFGAGNRDTKHKDQSRGAQVGFYQTWGNPNDLDDNQYFPPQNVLIKNNVFHGAKYTKTKGSIYISGDYGFLQKADGKSVTYNGNTVIRGTIVKDNFSDQPIFRKIDNPNISLIKQSNNKSGLSEDELKKLGFKIRKK